MNFSTKIPIEKHQNLIDYNSKIICLGSCFAENIGAKFDYFKFQNTINPFGIIFNTISIEKLIERAVTLQLFTEEDCFFQNDLWHCFAVHSVLSNGNKELFLKNLNEIVTQTHDKIATATHLIITYGTSWVYRNKSSNQVVANCHKIPQNQFEKEILSVETTNKSIKNTIDLICKINPHCNIIFTISPVRHIKDGFVENQRSKAHLISAMHATHSQQPTTYFPSYEIMMDELRDYRFYADDMLHPSQLAIDFIWEQFLKNYIHEAEYQTIATIGAIQKALSHKPFNFNSEIHQKFLTQIQHKIDTLALKIPHIKF